MSDLMTQILEYKEIISIILGLSGLYWSFDKRISKLEDWCNPFFSKMYDEAVDRVLTDG